MELQEMKNPDEVKRFIRSGKAEFTLESNEQHYSYKFKADKQKGNAIFVSILIEYPNKWVYKCPYFVNSEVNTHLAIRDSLVSSQLLKTFIDSLDKEGKMHSQIKFYHHSKCGRCGRKLTDPESIRRGLGKECAEK